MGTGEAKTYSRRYIAGSVRHRVAPCAQEVHRTETFWCVGMANSKVCRTRVCERLRLSHIMRGLLPMEILEKRK